MEINNVSTMNRGIPMVIPGLRRICSKEHIAEIEIVVEPGNDLLRKLIVLFHLG